MEYQTYDISRYIDKDPRLKGPLDILPEQFCGLLVGQPNSGKTSLVVAMLKAPFCLYKKFDLTLFVSPYPIKGLDLKKDRWSKHFSVSWIKDRINYFKKIKNVQKVFVFLDDSVSTITKSAKQDDVTNFFFNRRKLVEGVEISVMVTTQKFTRFHADFRSSCDFHIFFPLPNNDLERVAEEVSDNKQIFKSIAKAHWSANPEKKPFIYVRRVPEYKLFLNFSETV